MSPEKTSGSTISIANDRPTLLIASDHAGFDLKSFLLKSLHLKWRDLGPANTDRVDYPDYAQSLCKELLLARKTDENGFGILICGSGQGMAMAANRFKGIRAALAWNEESTLLSRAHNNANILCLGARLIEPALAVNLVEIFLRTPFEGARHTGRIEKIEC